MIKAVLFDFWGTLVENGEYSPLKQTFTILGIRGRYGMFVPKFEGAVMTKKFETPEDAFIAGCKAFKIPVNDDAIERIVSIWQKNAMRAKIFPETIEALESLKKKGLKLAIITNSPCFFTAEVIESFKLKKYFDEIIYSYDVGIIKTNPRIFDMAAKKLGVSKEELMMVGDSKETDIYGAEKAEVKAVLVDRNGKRIYKNKADDLMGVEIFLD
ncbi:MAG: HAD family hydrolase [Nanoarchaeota archaeon]